MIVLTLDLSTRTGGAVFDTASSELLIDVFDIDKKGESPLSTNTMLKGETKKARKRKAIATRYDPSNHPLDFLIFVDTFTDLIFNKVKEIKPDRIVVEQTNKGRDRWRQKLIEWIHQSLMTKLALDDYNITYIDTIEWRRLLDLKLSAQNRKDNKLIREYNRNKKPDEEGAVGIVDEKDLAINFVEKTLGYKLKKKENDIADAICIGLAYLKKEGIVLR